MNSIFLSQKLFQECVHVRSSLTFEKTHHRAYSQRHVGGAFRSRVPSVCIRNAHVSMADLAEPWVVLIARVGLIVRMQASNASEGSRQREAET